MKVDEAKVRRFQYLVLNFWEKEGRKTLPWRLTIDPWRILLAEILLRKTSSRQIIDVYEQLSVLSPEQIASLSVEQLESLLRPLGMYRVRAVQLLSICQAVAKKGLHSLEEPSFLAQLPGVGRYINNAVLCFAFGQPKPALDTNMIRVLRRVFGVTSQRSRAREDLHLWQFAESIIPDQRCREFNWGILDLAASICKHRNPHCSECPLNELCNFYVEVKVAKKAI
jgi:A/G-specific adenine glycosylase